MDPISGSMSGEMEDMTAWRVVRKSVSLPATAAT